MEACYVQILETFRQYGMECQTIIAPIKLKNDNRFTLTKKQCDKPPHKQCNVYNTKSLEAPEFKRTNPCTGQFFGDLRTKRKNETIVVTRLYLTLKWKYQNRRQSYRL